MNSRILTFVAYYLPGYQSGGPVRTIANLVDQLGQEFDFRIVTRDRDAFDCAPYPGIQVDAWNEVGNTRVFYASPGQLSLIRVRRLLRETHHELLYLNSFFNPVFTLLPLLARRLDRSLRRPVIVAPRGEFSRGAIELKAWKKTPYVRFVRAARLFDDVVWQASSEREADDIRRTLDPPPARIRIASDLPSRVRSSDVGAMRTRSREEALRVVFLSRISPKKNLDFAIRAVAQVAAPVDLDIFGPVDDVAYWERCQKLMRSVPGHVGVQYRGVIPHEQVHDTLARYDLFLLPTRGENYGHVIFEALAAGTPVLISDQTPWRDLETAGVGWVLPLGLSDAYTRVIEEYGAAGADVRNSYRERAARYAARHLMDESRLAANRALFLDALESS